MAQRSPGPVAARSGLALETGAGSARVSAPESFLESAEFGGLAGMGDAPIRGSLLGWAKRRLGDSGSPLHGGPWPESMRFAPTAAKAPSWGSPRVCWAGHEKS